MHTQHITCTSAIILVLPWYQKGKNQEGKTDLDLLEQEMVSGSGISWAICKYAPHPRQITTQHPTTQFLQAGCPFCHPTNSIKALNSLWITVWYFCLAALIGPTETQSHRMYYSSIILCGKNQQDDIAMYYTFYM